MLQYGVMVKKLPGRRPRDGEQDRRQVRARASRSASSRTSQIWQNKSRIDNPLLCEEDGPVYQLRRWYEQFYVDVADVTGT